MSEEKNQTCKCCGDKSKSSQEKCECTGNFCKCNNSESKDSEK